MRWEGSGDVEAFGCEGGGKCAFSKRALMWRFGSHLLSCKAFMMLGLSVNGNREAGWQVENTEWNKPGSVSAFPL